MIPVRKMAPPLPKLPQTRCKIYEKLAKSNRDSVSSLQAKPLSDTSDGNNLNFSIKETIIEEDHEDDVFCEIQPRASSNYSPYPAKIKRTKTNLGKRGQNFSTIDSTSEDDYSLNQRDGLSLGAEAAEFTRKKEGTLESVKRFPSVSSTDPTPRNSSILQTSGSAPLLNTTKESHYSALPTLRYTSCDFIMALSGIFFYFFDVASDVFVAVLYYMNGKIWWFVLTIILIIGPSLVSSAFSLYWYYMDYKKLMKCGDERLIRLEKPSKRRWFCRIVFVTFQLGPVLRYEDVDASMLKLFECFLESAPQLVFQLYVLTQVYGTGHVIFMVGQFFSIIFSISSLSYSLTAYFRALRMSHSERKASVTEWRNALPGVVLQFFWRYFTIGTRVLAMALFASVFTWYIFIFCGIHYVIVFTWILLQNTSFFLDENNKRKPCAEFLFDIVVAWIHLYCFFNVKEGHTRIRYIIFYTIVYVENLILTFSWFIKTQTDDLPYHTPALLLVVIGFWVGMFFMLLYYLRFHPNDYPLVHEEKKIRFWIPCSELLHGSDMHNTPVKDHGVKKKDRVEINDNASISTFEPREQLAYNTSV